MHRSVPILTAAAAALALVGVAGPVAAAPAGPAAATATAPVPVRSVTLVTGDTVTVRGAQVAVSPRSRTGAAGSFQVLRADGTVSVIPAVVRPYLGRQLDPRLFDVSALAAAPAGRLPVTVAWRAGAARRALPGMTVTAVSGDTETGYLTPASARRFGEALAADAAAGARRSGGLLDGVAAVRYAGRAAPVEVQPRYPMVTLRIPVLDSTGAPAPYGSVTLVNADDGRRYAAFLPVDAGEVRVSVPIGTYGLFADIPEFTPDGRFVDRLVNVSDVEVTGPATLPAVDARTARVPVGVTTPRPATTEYVSVVWWRGTPGAVSSSGYSFTSEDQVLIAPGAPARKGILRWDNSWQSSGPDRAYTYDLLWSADGAVPTRQRFAATAADVATLNTSYHSEVDRTMRSVRFGTLPGDEFASAFPVPVQAPATRPEYVGGDPRVIWSQQVIGFEYVDETTFLLADIWYGGGRRYSPGETVPVRWGRAPLHPSLTRSTGQDPDYLCPACRSGDTLGIYLSPLADTDPTHLNVPDDYGDTPVGPITADTRLQVWQGGTLLSDQAGYYGATVTVPAGDRKYRVRYEQRRTVPWSTLATAADTEWTFRSSRPAAREVPAGWRCGTADPACAALPMLVPGYQVPTDLHNRVAAGPGPVAFTVAANQGAPASPVDTATLRWSTDDGATWTAVPVRSQGAGRFAATLPNPAGATVSLRITAADRAGNTITQTLVRAYAVR